MKILGTIGNVLFISILYISALLLLIPIRRINEIF